jgi:hypothetical protein
MVVENGRERRSDQVECRTVRLSELRLLRREQVPDVTTKS